MVNITEITTGTISDIISNLNGNFDQLKESFANKKVETSNLNSDSITNNKIKNGAITTDKIKDSAVITDTTNKIDKIKDSAVTTNKIVNGAISLEKFEDETTNLQTKITYMRSIYMATNLDNTKQSIPVGSIVLYYRDSPINENEDINGLKEVTG